MVLSSPTSPSPIRRPVTKRTYGRRGARPAQHRAITPDLGSDTDTDNEDKDKTAAGTSSSARDNGGSSSRSEETKGFKRPRIDAAPTASSSRTGSQRTSLGTPHGSGVSNLSGSMNGGSAQARPSSSSSSVPGRKAHAAASGTTTPTRKSSLPAHVRNVGSPRDLSPLFEAVSPKRSNSSQGSHAARPRARRMLSRAESMQSASHAGVVPASAPTTPRTLRTTQSMPITPGGEGAGASAASPAAGGAESPAAPPALVSMAPETPSPGGRARRTYGGTRSFLAPRSGDLDKTLAAEARPSYAELRKEYEVDTGDDDDAGRTFSDEYNLARAPEPISNMRSKGENRRFMDELGSVVDAITDATQSAALKRSSALDILSSMQDEAWISKLHTCGQVDHVFQALCGARAGDEIMNSASLLYLALLVQNDGLREVLQSDAHSVVTVLRASLNVSTGPLDDGYKLKVTPTVQKLRTIASRLLKGSTRCCTRNLAALVLAALCEHSNWTLFESAAMADNLIEFALRLLFEQGAELYDRLEMFEKGLELLPSDDSVDLDYIEHTLQAVSRAVAWGLPLRAKLAQESKCIVALLKLFVPMVALALDKESDSNVRSRASRCAVLLLETLAPLATLARSEEEAEKGFRNASKLPGVVPAFGRLILHRKQWPDMAHPRTQPAAARSSSPAPDATSTASERDESEVNPVELLILACPVLHAMLPKGQTDAVNFANTPVSPCGGRECVFGCRCLESVSFAVVVASVYTPEDVAEVDAVEADDSDGQERKPLLHMFVTLLLAHLLLAAPSQLRPLVEDRLPGGTWRAKVQGVLDQLVHYQSVCASAFEAIAKDASRLGALAEGSIDDDGGDGLLLEAIGRLQALCRDIDE